MKNIYTFLLVFIFIFIFIISGDSYSYDEKNHVYVTVQSFTHEKITYFAISYKNEQKWHTYWKNPGHAGIPLKNSFYVDNSSIELIELEWPVPRKFIEGKMVSYGYIGTYTLFYKIPPKTLKIIKNKQIKISSQVLSCKNICIPENKTINGFFDKSFKQKSDFKFIVENEDLITSLNNLPKSIDLPKDLKIELFKSGEDKLTLFFEYISKVPFFDTLKKDLLTPFPSNYISFAGESVLSNKNQKLYGKNPGDWNGIYFEPETPLSKNGRFERPQTLLFLFFNPETKITSVVGKTFNGFNINDFKTKNEFFKTLSPLKKNESKTTQENNTSTTFLIYILLALLGGVILNFMPCVLPIISLKLFSLIRHQEYTKKEIFKHNIFYSLGILFSFLALGAAVIFLKRGGEVVGWGFQLQSNIFVGSMILLLFVFSLNLFGLFEFTTPFGKTIGHFHIKDSYLSDFFNGVIATILSTPCSAPFLGTALTFAFTTNDASILIIFTSIGVGLAFPFLLTAIFPKTLSFLPKPGIWMDHLKKVLGFALIATAIWLLDIFNALTENENALFLFNFVLALVFFTFYFIKKISNKKLYSIPLILVTITITATFFYHINTLNNPPGNDKLSKEIQLKSIKWTPEKLIDTTKIIFIDFTAKWCLTCKINEKLVINTDGFKSLMNKYDVRFMIADWTHRDPVIGNWLKKHQVVGVPAYFIQDKSGNLHYLGELTSLSEIKEQLEKISK